MSTPANYGAALPPIGHLVCHTAFSFRYGVLSPERLVEQAAAWGIGELVLADINNTSCAIEFVNRCKKAGIKPILGISFWRDGEWLYTGIARNEHGWRELCAFLSKHSLDELPLPDFPPALPHTWIIYPRLRKPIQKFRENELLGIRPQHVNALFKHELLRYQHKLVALAPVVGITDEDHDRHRVLRAIDLNTLHTKLEKKDLAHPDDRLLPPAQLLRPYTIYPRILQTTRRVLDGCDAANIATGLAVNRQTFMGSREGDLLLLKKLTFEGLRRRYPDPERYQKAYARAEQELKVIAGQKFAAYFLITYDIVRYARISGFQHVGRGSGANSIVAYGIGISDVDPLELDLYFERFINPYRASPPDFDIDFSWDERDEVIEYVFTRYGREHTALLATYSTFKGKAALREVGKVYGLPKEEIDRLVRDPLGLAAREAAKFAEVVRIARGLVGLPNHLGIHAGGILITERPIHYHTAQRLMPKGFPVAHCDMYHAEEAGLHKYDVLSQRGLGHLRSTLELIKRNRDERVDILDLDRIKQDARVKFMLKSGRALGCFYIESPAMRSLLTKLACSEYVHLVAASSIIRPGVAKSGMMKEYIHRFHHPDSFEYIAPVFEEQLSETFGVMVYQEDVMKIVHHFAGLNLDESDVLRRIMSGKRHNKDTFDELQRKFFAGAQVRGHSDETAKEVWRQVESFSGYSFCKAHSASFAVESFQSMYLKAHYPLEFMVGVINNFGGFYRTEFYIHEARMDGGTIHPPCVNTSEYLTTLNGDDIHLGFIHVKSVQEKLARELVLERRRHGAYRSLTDFCTRTKATDSQIEILVRIGGFRFTGCTKAELLWEKNSVFEGAPHAGNTGQLFGPEAPDAAFALDRSPNERAGHPLTGHQLEQAFDELELLGFPLCSPFLLTEKTLDVSGTFPSRPPVGSAVNAWGKRRPLGILAGLPEGHRLDTYAYFVCDKVVPTIKGDRMSFGCWLDPDGNYFDTVHFPDSLLAFPFEGKGVYALQGVVSLDFDFPSVEVSGMKRLAFIGDHRFGPGEVEGAEPESGGAGREDAPSSETEGVPVVAAA